MAPPKTLTVEESTKLLEVIETNHLTRIAQLKCVRNYAMTCCMLDAGLRVGEVVQLRCLDLWFNSEPVKSIIISPDIAKNNKERSIPVSTRLCETIKKLSESFWSHYSLSLEMKAFATSRVFKAPTTRQVQRIIEQAGLKALGRKVHPHILRHTFASRLMRVTNIRNVQALLGHTSISSTQVYTHPNSDDLHKAIDALS